MRFTPKTAEQIEAENMLEEGRYPFTVKQCEEKTDKNGNPFFKLKLFVHAPDGRDWHIFDNVSMAWMAHKFLHICEAVGLSAKYEAGAIAHTDLLEREGYCEVSMKPAKGEFPAANIIVDYFTGQELRREEKVKAPKAEPVAKADPSDDVPF